MDLFAAEWVDLFNAESVDHFARKLHTIKIQCEHVENGIRIREQVVVQKHPERQYLSIIRTTDYNLKTSIDILGKIKLSNLDLGVKAEVIEMREKLNQFSSRTQDIIKSSYNALQTAPCDKEIRKENQKLLSDIAKENFALERLKTGLTKITNKINSDSTMLIRNLINEYKANNGESAFIVASPSDLNLSKMHSRGWFFNDEINGALRLSPSNSNLEYFPNDGFLTDSMNLSKDFVIETRARSLNPKFGEYGMNYNYDIENRSTLFIITTNPKNGKPVIYIGPDEDKERKGGLFSKHLDLDISKYHNLQINKSGDLITFYLDNIKMFETSLVRIESKKLKIYAKTGSDVTFDYIRYYYYP